jgi:hypothetical protein
VTHETVLQTIEWGPNDRILIVPDQDASNPRTNGDYMLTGFVKIPGHGDSRLNEVPGIYEPGLPIQAAYDKINESMWARHLKKSPNNYDVSFSRATIHLVERWARVFHNTKLYWDFEYGGFWFVNEEQLALNWPGIEIPDGAVTYKGKQVQRPELEEEIISDEREQYRIWAEGETEGWIHQRRMSWARVEQDEQGLWELVSPLTEDDVTEQWEDESSLWGCAGYSSEDRMLEFPVTFDLPERVVL